MNALDENLIEEAENVRFSSRVNKRIVAIAASIALVIGICSIPFLPFPSEIPPQETVQDAIYHWDAKSGKFYIPGTVATTSGSSGIGSTNENQYAAYEQDVTTFQDTYTVYADDRTYLLGAYEGYVRNGSIHQTHVGERIGSVLVANGDGKTSNAEVYSVKDVNSDYIVCVKTRNNQSLYALFYDPDMHAADFDTFKQAYALQEHLYVGNNVIVSYDLIQKAETLEQLHSVTDTVKNLMLQAQGTAISYEEFLNRCSRYDGIGIEATHGRLYAQTSQGIRVFAEGYLMTNLGGPLSFFDIGTETAKAIIEAAERVAKEDGKIVVYGVSDGIFDGAEEEKEDLLTEPAYTSERVNVTSAAKPYLPTETTTARPPHMPLETMTERDVVTVVPDGLYETVKIAPALVVSATCAE